MIKGACLSISKKTLTIISICCNIQILYFESKIFTYSTLG